jgi:mannose-6-phosphate isomerase-like protein (cupin superfamily)
MATTPGNLPQIANAILTCHSNQILSEVNDHCLRLAVNHDSTFEWHSHSNSDELFIVLEGQLEIDFQDSATLVLVPGDFATVARGRVHRTRAIGRTVNLCIESTKSATDFI